ncbi:MAG: CotH kinase family protein [Caldilineaceae bacterium]|nr:CotH kinase family protein [Caldilineaceae bacterium]
MLDIPLRATVITLGLIVLAASLLACVPVQPTVLSGAAAAPVATPDADDEDRPAGWTEATHSNDVAPNYDVVFPIDAVNTLTITIAPDDWAAMQADLEDIYAPSLYIRQGILAAGPDLSQEERDKLLLELVASRAAERSAAALVTVSETVTTTGVTAAPALKEQMVFNRSPMWVPATITFQGQEWPHVGVRHKGATSLSMPWLVGDMRLPFKFDFDQFEDDFPEIKNQRFFGFKQISLANNHEDPAAMRDALVYELLGEAGLPSLRTAPYAIMLDYGEGPVRLGLYTMVEVVDDTGVPSYFGSDDGNIYEGEGWGASLASQDSHLIEDSFQKKNNEKEEDWSDIWALYEVLNAEQRTSDPEAWRADLEAVFDVDGFLEWLGIAAVVGHVDTYGAAYHHFHLFNDPATGKLTWFSWDHNMTFLETMRPHLTFDKAEITDAWPLIRFLLDDPVYAERYARLLAENFATVLAPDAVIAKIRAHAELLAPVATQDMSQEEYDAAVQELVGFVTARAADGEAFLAR